VQVLVFVKSERSFVTVGIVNEQAKLQPSNGPIAIRLIVRNGGKSTAIISDAVAYGKFIPGPLPYIPDYPAQYTVVSGPILPGGSIFASERPSYIDGEYKGKNVIFDQASINAVDTHQMMYFVYGYVIYDDDFSFFGGVWALGHRITGFCYMYQPDNIPQFGMWDVCSNPRYVYAH